MASPSAATLTGVLERIIFFNEENHYTIAEFRRDDNDQKTTIVGALPGAQCGETLHLRGQWTTLITPFTDESPSALQLSQTPSSTVRPGYFFDAAWILLTREPNGISCSGDVMPLNSAQ